MERVRSAVGPDRRACLVAGLAALGTLWTIAEALNFLVPHSFAARPAILVPLLLVAATTVGILLGPRPKGADLRIGASDTIISLRLGDLFATPGARVIPVNDFFDGSLGRHVSPQSIHGQFLTRCFPHREQDFEDQSAQALAGRSYEQTVRPTGRDRRYPIGTTVAVGLGDDCYLLVALAHTDIDTLETNADMSDLWQALDGMWNEARHVANGRDVVVPLVGAGLSRIGLPARQLLDLLIMSLVQATKTRKVTERVVIVLTPLHILTVDLRDVVRSWT